MSEGIWQVTTAMPGKFVKAEGWLHESAAAQVGLDDLGGLRVLLEALDNDLKGAKPGFHRYTLDDFGLTADMIRRDYREDVERYYPIKMAGRTPALLIQR